MRRIIVFLGPSLERATAETILPAEYRPPAKRGDLLWAVQDGAEVIGLIDGVFHQESAVAHREILTAIKKGVRVVGASSMGALRAAEMDTLGMTGIGEVYQMYKSGDLISDDEVALVFDPESGISLSEALVNIRFTLREAERQEIITPAGPCDTARGCTGRILSAKDIREDRVGSRCCNRSGNPGAVPGMGEIPCR